LPPRQHIARQQQGADRCAVLDTSNDVPIAG
jgi:hypothetical protein